MVTLCAAMDVNNVIGDTDAPYGMPWDCLTDRMFFRRHTWSSDCIVGRVTWNNLPSTAKEGRNWHILTNDVNRVDHKGGLSVKDTIWTDVENLHSLIQNSTLISNVVICGGASIYRQAIEQDIVDRLFITRFQYETSGDIYFPQFSDKYNLEKNDQIKTNFQFKTPNDKWVKKFEGEIQLQEYTRR